MIDLVEIQPLIETAPKPVAIGFKGSLVVFDDEPEATLGPTLQELGNEFPPDSLVKLYDRTRFTRDGAWCALLDAHPTPGIKEQNPWRKIHTVYFWGWWRPFSWRAPKPPEEPDGH